MQEQDRELAPSSVDVAATIALKSSSSNVGRMARGTTPPDLGSDPAETTVYEMVQCKTCKARLPFANAIIMQSHCLCSSCVLADARAAAVKALPKQGENVRLDHQLGAPLAMLIVTVVLTALLLIVYSL